MINRDKDEGNTMDASSNLSARQQPPRREHGRVHENVDVPEEDPFFPEVSRPEPVMRKKIRTMSTRYRKPLVIGAIVLVLIIIVAMVMRMLSSGIPGVDSSRYQAVFLSDGTVYVGKLSAIDGAHYKLASVYLVTSNQSSAVTSDKGTGDVTATTALTRLENGLLGAENTMTIARDHVLFYENLKTDGNAAKLIANDQK